MARLIGGLYGKVSGKVGDVIYRNRGGNTIVCALPRERMSPRTELELEQQSIFALTGKIARVINSEKMLKHFWKPDKQKSQSRYNVIFKNNYRMLDIKDLSGKIIIVPAGGFNLEEPSVKGGKGNLLIECQPLESNAKFNTKVEKFVSAVGIIVLKNPTAEWMPLYEIMTFRSEKQILNPKKPLTLDVEFAGGRLKMFESFSLKKISAVFITTDNDGNPVQNSAVFTNRD
jgi:hypothetical protein